MNILQYTLALLSGLAGFQFLIFVHELGHLLAGKLLGFRSSSFNIGAGTKIISLRLAGVAFNLRALPIGGAVVFDDITEELTQKGKVSRVETMKWIGVFLAGPLASLLLMYPLTFAALGTSVTSGNSGTQRPLTVVERLDKTAKIPPLLTSLLINSILPTKSQKAPELMGTIGIVKSLTDNNGALYFWILTAVTCSLGIMNLLPLPVLDGGQILFLLYRFFAGRNVPEAIQENARFWSGLFILGLLLFANISDIVRLFTSK